MDQKKFKQVWDSQIDQAIQNTNQESEQFKIKPVSPKEFFEVWLREPLFPEQYRIIDQVFTKDYQNWETERYRLD